jgi:ribosomal protein S18 acetylase RimI-like enzyme
LGLRLVEAVIQAARQAGYSELRLDTLPTMVAAQILYRRLGFAEIAPYGSAHLPGTRFYALKLASGDSCAEAASRRMTTWRGAGDA